MPDYNYTQSQWIGLYESTDESRRYWEKQAKNYRDSSDYYQAELAKAHTLLGRILHQMSDEADSVNLTEYFPTSNPHGKHTVDNPSGKSE